MVIVWAGVLAVASALLLLGVWVSCWSMRETAARIRSQEALDGRDAHRPCIETQSTSMGASAPTPSQQQRHDRTVPRILRAG